MASTRPLVLLTGPNGFVGAHVLDLLLRSGYRVRGTVRSASKSAFLEERYPAQMTNDELSFAIVPDIQAPHALDDAMSDVDFACHVASPYFTSSEDPLKELIEPAVNGTKNVISSALQSATLKRLTIMSSFAAVIDIGKGRRPGYTYTSADWNPITLDEGIQNGYFGYFASKALAERAAWDMWRETKPAWDLVTFCPPMVYGPPLHEVDPSHGIAGLNTSLKRLMSSITGQDPAYTPKVASFAMPAGIDNFEDGLGELRAKGETGLGEEGEKVDRSEFYSIDRTKAETILKIEFIPFLKTVGDVWASMKKIKIIQ